MKLLIVTQAVDRNDPVLGFFHRWLEAFSKQFEQIEVICLKEGEHALPSNVHVHSLGKERGRPHMGAINYARRFKLLAWRLRHDYDAVFVHMNQEYVLIAGLLWKVLGKSIYLWRNHAKGSFFTRLAVALADKVFYTSPQSYTARFKKAVQMPVGIDTDFFSPDPLVQKKPHSILFLGRIAPVKRVDLFIDILDALKKRGVDFSATIAGAALPDDEGYERAVKAKVSEYGLQDKVRFVGAVSRDKALALYRSHELYVNLTPSGSLDKTIFEAMACETPVLVSNQGLRGSAKGVCVSEDVNIASGIEKSFGLPAKEGRAARVYVVETHGLTKLVRDLFDAVK